jgi:ketosteroid isomerase-like protein
MSENMDRLLASIDVYNAGDMDAWARFHAPDARWETLDVYPLGADRAVSGSMGRRGCRERRPDLSQHDDDLAFRDGLMVKVEFYFDHDEALKAWGVGGVAAA